MTQTPATSGFTLEAYLLREAEAVEKHEFHDGEVLAMSGGTYRHSLIAANFAGEVRLRLKGSPCRVLESNMRVGISEAGRCVYPDGTVVYGEPAFDPRDRNQTTIINPTLVLEVLSDSTEAYDRGAKFSAYRTISTQREYVLVSQREAQVEAFFRRDDGAWLISAWSGLDATARLRSVEIDLPLAEVYAGLESEMAPPRAEAGA